MLWTIFVILLILWLLGLVRVATRWVESFTSSWSSPSLWCWSELFRDEDHFSRFDPCRRR